jgi:hypothetical protein
VDRFDAPLAAGDLREAGGAGLSLVEAGDGVDDFLADQLPVAVVAVAADPGDAAEVREVDAAGVGDPDGAADGAAVAQVQVQFGVIGFPGAAGLDGVEEGFLQFRVAALDEAAASSGST